MLLLQRQVSGRRDRDGQFLGCCHLGGEGKHGLPSFFAAGQNLGLGQEEAVFAEISQFQRVRVLDGCHTLGPVKRTPTHRICISLSYFRHFYSNQLVLDFLLNQSENIFTRVSLELGLSFRFYLHIRRAGDPTVKVVPWIEVNDSVAMRASFVCTQSQISKALKIINSFRKQILPAAVNSKHLPDCHNLMAGQ